VEVSGAGGRPALREGHRLLSDALSGAKAIELEQHRPELMDTSDSLSTVAPRLHTWASSERLIGGSRAEALGAVAEAAARLEDYEVLCAALLAAEDRADRNTIVRTVLDADFIPSAGRIEIADRVLAADDILDHWGRALVCLRRAELAVADPTGAHDAARLVHLATEAVLPLTGSSLASLQWRLAVLHLHAGSTVTSLNLLREWGLPQAEVWRSDVTLAEVAGILSRHQLPAEAARYARLASVSCRRPGVLASIVERLPGDHATQADEILAEATSLASALADPWDRRHALLDVAQSAFRGARCVAATKALALIGPVDAWVVDLLSGLEQANLPAASVDWLVETVRDDNLPRLSRVDRAMVAVQLALLCDASAYPDAQMRLRRAAGHAAVSNVLAGDPVLARLVALGLARCGHVDDAAAVIAGLPDAQGAVLVALEVQDNLGATPAGRRSSSILDLAARTTRRCEHPGVRDRLMAAVATRYVAIGAIAQAIDALGAVRSHGIRVAATKVIVATTNDPSGDLDEFLATMIRRVDRLDVFWTLVPAVYERTPTSERLSYAAALLDTDRWSRQAKAAAVRERR
jgi:hypothetical protein